MNTSRPLISALVISGLLALVAGSPVSSSAQGPVKIGGMGPLTGPVAFYGKHMMEGEKMAVDEINSAGGVLGRKLELVFLDDGSDTEKGVTAAKQLIERDKVDILMGTQRSGVALALLELAADHRIPYIITAAADTGIIEKIASDPNRYKYIFRTAPDASDLASGPWPFVTETLKAKTFYFVSETTVWAKTLYKSVQKLAQRDGITEVGTAWHDASATEFTSTILDIKKKKPDFVFCGLIAGDAPFYKQYTDAQGPAPVVFQQMDIPTLQSLGDRAENLVASVLAADLPITSKTKPFFENYQKRTKMVAIAYHDIRAYDAVHIYAAAVKKAGSFDKDKVAAAMLANTFEGAAGNYQFDQKTHQPKWAPGFLNSVVYQWQRGRQVVLFPKELRQGDYIPLKK
jgi:branched-chain amino acid transport system substrate-binding protein